MAVDGNGARFVGDSMKLAKNMFSGRLFVQLHVNIALGVQIILAFESRRLFQLFILVAKYVGVF